MAMVVGYGCGFGLMSSTWGICFNVLLVGASARSLALCGLAESGIALRRFVRYGDACHACGDAGVVQSDRHGLRARHTLGDLRGYGPVLPNTAAAHGGIQRCAASSSVFVLISSLIAFSRCAAVGGVCMFLAPYSAAERESDTAREGEEEEQETLLSREDEGT